MLGMDRDGTDRDKTDRDGVRARLVASAGGAGLILDFDGVLSPIVDDPTTSVLPTGVRDDLIRIGDRLGLVAVLSGRPLSFLVDRVGIEGVTLIGSYGAEREVDGEIAVDERVRPHLPQVRRATELLAVRLPPGTGIRVEEKSTSVAVHWRQAADRAAASALVHEQVAEVAAVTGLAVEPGKLVEELRAPVRLDKGSAVSRLLERGYSASVYVGDDLGDLPAFRAVTAAGGWAMLVDHGAETADELRAAADATLDGVDGMRDWLARLAAELPR
jgi:trehalose 6-phosphate phosphatase